jgi:hypothetical protein
MPHEPFAFHVEPQALIEKTQDADLPREMIGFTARRVMELEVGRAHPMARRVPSGWCSATATGTEHGRPVPAPSSSGPSEVETFWTDFLRKLRQRGIKLLVVSARSATEPGCILPTRRSV